jgi:hypothetical protein
MPIVAFSNCHAGCHCDECRYAECHCDECRCAALTIL